MTTEQKAELKGKTSSQLGSSFEQFKKMIDANYNLGSMEKPKELLDYLPEVNNSNIKEALACFSHIASHNNSYVAASLRYSCSEKRDVFTLSPEEKESLHAKDDSFLSSLINPQKNIVFNFIHYYLHAEGVPKKFIQFLSDKFSKERYEAVATC